MRIGKGLKATRDYFIRGCKWLQSAKRFSVIPLFRRTIHLRWASANWISYAGLGYSCCLAVGRIGCTRGVCLSRIGDRRLRFLRNGSTHYRMQSGAVFVAKQAAAFVDQHARPGIVRGMFGIPWTLLIMGSARDCAWPPSSKRLQAGARKWRNLTVQDIVRIS